MKNIIGLVSGVALSLSPIVAHAGALPASALSSASGPVVVAEYEFRNQALLEKKPTFTQRTLSKFDSTDRDLNSLQATQVRSVLATNPNATQFICTGIRLIGQPVSENIKLRQQAKAACELAKSLNPSLSVWFQSKPTLSQSQSGRVLLTVKTPRSEITTLATCEKGTNEKLSGVMDTNGNYICAEPVFDSVDKTKIISVNLQVVDAKGNSCLDSTNPDCTGYYLGWRMNFDDENRVVDYSGPKTQISDLQSGDSGAFQLMYEETPQTVYVDLSLRDSNGLECSDSNENCNGYYIGWAMNFSDDDREVSYQPGTRISGLQRGDAGNLLLMYQASADSEIIRVAQYAFSYQPGKSVVGCGDASLETALSAAISSKGNYICAVLGANRGE